VAEEDKIRLGEGPNPDPIGCTTLASRLQNSKLFDFKSIPQTECQRPGWAA